jgi:hypothetical protein
MQGMKIFLENQMRDLIIMKDEFLKDQMVKNKDQIHKVLLIMGCQLERIRVHLDYSIYPRDLSLNLIDVRIDENIADRKKAMHLTERMHSVVYKDILLVYDKCIEFDERIKKIDS